jgi:predicted unusual protein kinase regulating ubiquinone biosynthesis (AarF/ABC1/UbiB family)
MRFTDAGDAAAWKEMLSACHTRAANRLLELALENGGLYIKVGQSVPQLNHVIPVEFCRIMQTLNDRAYVRPIAEVNQVGVITLGAVNHCFFSCLCYQILTLSCLLSFYQVFAEEFGKPPTEVFVSRHV